MKNQCSHVSVSLPVRLIAALALAFSLCALPLAGCSSAQDAPAAGNEPAASQDASEQRAMSVSVVIDSSAADASVAFDGAVEISEGATVLDALKATGLEIDVQDSSYGAFVNAIGGLASFDFGSASGWTYEVNHEMVMESCDAFVLSDGDTVTWTYMV